MQYTSIFLAALAATTTLAAPGNPASSLNNKLQVILSGPSVHPSTNILRAGKRIEQPPSPNNNNGPFSTVELVVGANVQNQAYRCQILDPASKPLIIQRGANTDTTFADGDAGKWTLKSPSAVSKIICDPTFVKASASASEIRVQLSNQRIELGIQQTFTGGVREEKTVASGPFTTVEIEVGALVQKQDTRCQVVDKAGKPIVATRGANTDITFADGDKGEWKFQRESEVSKVICDPAFVAGGSA
ncbi:MAG: hypothetical protein Q9178_007464 [Gyalolechia marmorata]